MPAQPPNPLQDGTIGILLADNDVTLWGNSLVLGFEFCEPPVPLVETGCLPEESQNMLSTILLPV